MADREIPARYLAPWQRVTDEANRRKLAVEVRIVPGTEILDDGTTLRGSFSLHLRTRGGGEPANLGTVSTFDQAMAELRTAIAKEPLPGADALREELVAFGRRLALLTPRDVQKKRGADFRIYRDFRDRILPLAWDNLVDSVRIEALEDFARRVGATTTDPERVPVDDWRALAAEARGLVAPKEEIGGSDGRPAQPEEPAGDVQPAPARRRRAKPKAEADGG